MVLTKDTRAKLRGAGTVIDTAILRSSEKEWADTSREVVTAGPLAYAQLGAQHGFTEEPPTAKLLKRYKDYVTVLPVRYRGTPLVCFRIDGLPAGTFYRIAEVRFLGTNPDATGKIYDHTDTGTVRIGSDLAGEGKPWDPYDSPSGWPDRPGIYKIKFAYKLKGREYYIWVKMLITYDDIPGYYWLSLATYSFIRRQVANRSPDWLVLAVRRRRNTKHGTGLE